MIRRLLAAFAAMLVLCGVPVVFAGGAFADSSTDWLNTPAAETVNPAYAGAADVAARHLPAGTVLSQKEVDVTGIGDVQATQLQVVDQEGQLAVVTILHRPGASGGNLVHLPPTDRGNPNWAPSSTLVKGEQLAGETPDRLVAELDSGMTVIIPDSYGRFGTYASPSNGERVGILSRAAIEAAGTNDRTTDVSGYSGGARDALAMVQTGYDKIVPGLRTIWASSPAINGPMMVNYSSGSVSSMVVIVRAGSLALRGIQDTDPGLTARVSDELHPSAKLAAAILGQQITEHPELENWLQYMGLVGLRPESFTKNGQGLAGNPALQEAVDRLTIGAAPTGARIILSCSSNDRFLDCQQSKDAVARYQALGVDAQFVETPSPVSPAHTEANWSDVLAAYNGGKIPSSLEGPIVANQTVIDLNEVLWGAICNTVVPALSSVVNPALQAAFTVADLFVNPPKLPTLATPAVKEAVSESAPAPAEAPAVLPAPVAPAIPDLATQAQKTWEQATKPVTEAVDNAVHAVQNPAPATPPQTDRIDAAGQVATQVAPQYAPQIAAVTEAAKTAPFAQDINNFLGTLPIPAPASVPAQ